MRDTVTTFVSMFRGGVQRAAESAATHLESCWNSHCLFRREKKTCGDEATSTVRHATARSSLTHMSGEATAMALDADPPPSYAWKWYHAVLDILVLAGIFLYACIYFGPGLYRACLLFFNRDHTKRKWHYHKLWWWIQCGFAVVVYGGLLLGSAAWVIWGDLFILKKAHDYGWAVRNIRARSNPPKRVLKHYKAPPAHPSLTPLRTFVANSALGLHN